MLACSDLDVSKSQYALRVNLIFFNFFSLCKFQSDRLYMGVLFFWGGGGVGGVDFGCRSRNSVDTRCILLN